jgi:hypothetical protein
MNRPLLLAKNGVSQYSQRGVCAGAWSLGTATYRALHSSLGQRKAYDSISLTVMAQV